MTEKLPGVLAEIADLVGEAAAIAIASHAGGTRIYLPALPTQDHWLTLTIGLGPAMKLCSHFAVDGKRGQRLDIPLYVGGTYRQMVRSIAQRVHRMDAEQASSTAIARALGISQRTIHRHRARHKGKRNGKQGNLFQD
jgi:hypothetical protein